MPRYKKTPIEKLKTKLQRLKNEQGVLVRGRTIKIRGKTLLSYTKNKVKYGKTRYYATKKDDLVYEGFSVHIPLNHKNLNLLSSNPINPPNSARVIVRLFEDVSSSSFNSIVLGAPENMIEGSTIHITNDLHDTIKKINWEEGRDKKVRFTKRMLPFLKTYYNIESEVLEIDKDYGAMLKEIAASGELSQEDLISLSRQLDTGNSARVVIEKQVNKQVEWLIATIEKIIDEEKLSISKAKDLGKDYFGFNKIDISGPEELMEKILTVYGQYTLFGVPALLNTDKYVVSPGKSKSQFDIILITHLGDIEVVELKRPDQTVMEYDKSRNKFYPSKDLAIAIAQAERYISAAYRDNDEEYLIKGMKIRDYINEEIGDTYYVESVRPTALILMGSWQAITPAYEKLSDKYKAKVDRADYNNDGRRAYKELKNSFKNIKIMNYAELLEHARTRLELTKTRNI